MAELSAPPVVAVDGPAASGKGTIALALAEALGFHYLDSGKLYRAAALAAHRQQVAVDDSGRMAALLSALTADADALNALLADGEGLRHPDNGQRASVLAADGRLRELLLPLQRAARRAPGLVADGRDMGTVVFPDALLRVFLTADVQVRAARRVRQLAMGGICATMESVCADLHRRDRQDSSRSAAPLVCADDALAVDTTHQSIGDIVQTILRAYRDAASHPSTAEQ